MTALLEKISGCKHLQPEIYCSVGSLKGMRNDIYRFALFGSLRRRDEFDVSLGLFPFR